MTDLISRADAIEALRGLFDMRKSRAKVIVECFGELLKALPSAEYSKPLQTTLNGDLVSRTDAIEAVGYEIDDGYNAIVDRIKALPSAEAVQGEWIFNTYEKTNKSWFECSVCGSDYFHKHNFCPNCGAKMKGSDDE